MSVAQIFVAVSSTLCLLIDSIVVGRLLGVDQMSAYGLASPLLIVLSALGLMSSSGIQVVCGKTIGSGDQEETNNCYSTSICMSIGMSLFGLLLIFTLWKPICTFLGAGEALPENRVFYMTGDYLKGYFLGLPAFFLNQTMAPYLQFGGKRRTLIWSVAVITATDIAADLLSVFVFHAGMFGIGLASSLSFFAGVLVEIGFFLKKDCPFRFRFKGIQRRVLWETVKAGCPVVINQICFTLRVVLLNHLLLAISGNDAVAVYAAISSLGNLFFCVGLGTSNVALTLSSILYGEEDRASLYELIRVMFRQTLALIATVVLLAELSAPWLARLFLGNEPDIVALAVPALRIYVLSLIPCALTTTFKYYYQGTQHMFLTHLISVLDSFLFTGLFAWIGSKLFGLVGVWTGIIVGEIAVCATVLLIAWKKHGGVSFSSETLAMLDKDFGARAEDCFNGTITDLENAAAVSEQIRSFCSERGVDTRKSYFISLCVEEMTVNIIQHGFTKDKRPHNIDVRLVVNEKDRLIRIRDNCVHFDPTAYFELHQTDDPTAHVGIRIVMASATEVNYVNTLGLNNLTLRL